MILKKKKVNLLEDGSPASTGHKPAAKKIITVSPEVSKRIALEKKVDSYAYRIRQEVKRLSALTDEISAAYSAYAESDDKIDSSPSIHNGLGNMMKLIEVQTTTKLRIKRMQTAIMQAIAAETPDSELPYALQDIMRDVNVNFLDSKLVRAYGEIARIMKEDLELAKVNNNEIKFANSQLSSELEAMPTVNTVDISENNNVEEIDETE